MIVARISEALVKFYSDKLYFNVAEKILSKYIPTAYNFSTVFKIL